ncbi:MULTISPECIES: hypothetical protein [Microbacterium]|uniref:hypothetical protein n=1 Tax=Microbacterium TaxID=33882 RepID=UPI0027848747|nr:MULTISPECIES: hypothetical protein [Microbacterium]MDQ1082026.1 hypothetical protein [Microbacterium sp. SORGH_AS_0344]MDQ1169207.1 hypothetical protein [Microbacterium proteolyticum]
MGSNNLSGRRATWCDKNGEFDGAQLADDAAFVRGLGEWSIRAVFRGAGLAITGVRTLQKAMAGDAGGAVLVVRDLAAAGAGRLVSRTIARAHAIEREDLKFENLPGKMKAEKRAARASFRASHRATWGQGIGLVKHVHIVSTAYAFTQTARYVTERFKQKPAR